MLVRVGLYDPIVPFWEPAAYVAQLRHVMARAAEGAARAPQAGGRRAPMVLLGVKAGGHTCYDTAEDDAAKAAFLARMIAQDPIAA